MYGCHNTKNVVVDTDTNTNKISRYQSGVQNNKSHVVNYTTMIVYSVALNFTYLTEKT